MRQPFLLRVEFSFELDHAHKAIGQIVKAFQRPMWKGMHGKRTIGFVIVTDETGVELLRRLRPSLDAISGIDKYWLHVAPPAVLAKDGSLDPLATAVEKAWAFLREGLRKKNVG
jgi:hypothetical protein